MTLTVADVIEALSGLRRTEAQAMPITNVVIDSRQAQPGAMFVALAGEHTDGHYFVADALSRGARVALVQRGKVALLDGVSAQRLDVAHPETPLTREDPLLICVEDPLAALQQLSAFWRLRAANPQLRVVGVTGSVGKTTTKELIAQVLATRFRVLKSEGNYNNEIGVPLTLLKLRPTHERAVIEMGMHQLGEIASYCQWARPHIGVVTMVAPVHLSRLGSIERIAQAKSELVQALPPAEVGGVAVLNEDDDRVRAMAALTRARVVTYGTAETAQVRASDIESFGLNGIAFTLHYDKRSLKMRLPLLGRHSVHTALRAAAVGLIEGMSLEEVAEAFFAPGEQLRLVMAKGPRGSLVLDDAYNASRESTLAALNLLSEISEHGPRVAVLGDMFELGELERQAHEEVGCRAGSVADYFIGVGARAAWMCRAAIECGAKPERVFHVNTNEEALSLLQQLVTERCVILVKGSRGMKMEEIVAGLGALAEAEGN
ncbi:MAG: UDP-N-acetylmuramoyl-tripeptide--D-alanyl-D-alanine ligase [Anaerolineae bacterium]|nr:UDP-N-acetylmuramoyl-tripeptide--D-alanyl-D-alanine ligase [Thermoflexales bacterium]MDW8395633.1 UDP-N-acetylmuramoyl-tripeptide--D-alanyl-D-alanine ligase [Anaerolineae bacterium]